MSAMKRKKDRYVALDTARGAAIIIIVSCHFLLFDGIHGAGAIGRAMADIGNFIFFAISAILFGLQLEKNGTSIFTFQPFFVKFIYIHNLFPHGSIAWLKMLCNTNI